MIILFDIMTQTNNKCIAITWNKGRGKCCDKKCANEFCGLHSKPSNYIGRCKDTKCAKWATNHQFAWEHLGRTDEPLSINCHIRKYYEEDIVKPIITRKIKINGLNKLVRIDFNRNEILSIYNDTIIAKFTNKDITFR